MVKVKLPSGSTRELSGPADLWALIREELGDHVGDLMEGTMILSGEELEDWWEMGCPTE